MCELFRRCLESFQAQALQLHLAQPRHAAFDGGNDLRRRLRDAHQVAQSGDGFLHHDRGQFELASLRGLQREVVVLPGPAGQRIALAHLQLQ